MIGIYKIENPKREVYIGQSKNIEKRLQSHKRLYNKNITKLYDSLMKYGVKNHVFKVIEVCDKELLNKRERHYQEYYNSIDMGLNNQFQGTETKKQVHSKSTIKKIRELAKGNKRCLGRVLSEDTKRKIGNANKGKKSFLNKTHSLKTKQKMSLSSGKLILNTETGVFHLSAKELSVLISIPSSTLVARLNGRMKNDTPYRYV